MKRIFKYIPVLVIGAFLLSSCANFKLNPFAKSEPEGRFVVDDNGNVSFVKGDVKQVSKKEKKEKSEEGVMEEVAVVETSKGRIVFKFFPEDAPKTVENFKKLANEKYYDGLAFHRVVPNFVIQGGDPNGDGTGGPGYTIKAEFNARPHLEGTVAMARAQDPNSAGSQYYICLDGLPQLDGKYTVFGQVIEGLEVVHQIKVGDKMEKVTIEEQVVPF